MFDVCSLFQFVSLLCLQCVFSVSLWLDARCSQILTLYLSSFESSKCQPNFKFCSKLYLINFKSQIVHFISRRYNCSDPIQVRVSLQPG